jgi:hypothetical protein
VVVSGLTAYTRSSGADSTDGPLPHTAFGALGAGLLAIAR